MQSPDQDDGSEGNQNGPQVRRANISRYHGEIIGICIFLSEDDLRALGINPADVDAVRYRISVNQEHLTLVPTSSSV